MVEEDVGKGLKGYDKGLKNGTFRYLRTNERKRRGRKENQDMEKRKNE